MKVKVLLTYPKVMFYSRQSKRQQLKKKVKLKYTPMEGQPNKEFQIHNS